MANPMHRSFIDGTRGPQLGGLPVVACRDCKWAQTVNEDLHEGAEGRLLAWHATHPEQAFDHLATRDPDTRLRIPDYVSWRADGFGGVVIVDERTGRMHDSHDHGCLAIFASVAEHGDLEAAKSLEAARLKIIRKQAHSEILLITSSLYRAGLLQPAPGSPSPPLPPT